MELTLEEVKSLLGEARLEVYAAQKQTAACQRQLLVQVEIITRMTKERISASGQPTETPPAAAPAAAGGSE